MTPEDEVVPGVVVKKSEKCPKCGGAVFRKPCPCFMRNQGWAVCARCLNPKCATVFGLKKRPRSRSLKRR